MKKTQKNTNLLECATLILPYLPPPALSSLAASCRAFRSVIITSDASRSIEKFPIPFINYIDSVPYSSFLYTKSPLAPNNIVFGSGCDCIPNCDSDLINCDCIPNCDSDLINCDCVVGDGGSESGVEMRRECGEKCGCGLDCVNRITQRGVSVKLKIFRVVNKGWGLFAAELVKKGGFICEYAGEYLTTEVSRKRQKVYDELASKKLLSPALIVIREHLPSGKACLRVNIDATKVGNVGRFINHSCDGGNLSAVLVRNAGSLLPRLCFFAAVDINDGSELTFSYGEYLTTEVSRKRQKVYDELASKKLLSPALIVIREHLPSGKACLRVNIDATKVGNVGRFINHSCDGGNLSAVLVRNAGSLLPRLCFFAAVDINDGSELTFSYGEGNVRSNSLPCFCGSGDCRGVLPSEDT